MYLIAENKLFTPSLNFVGSIEQVITVLKISKNIENLTIGIKE